MTSLLMIYLCLNNKITFYFITPFIEVLTFDRHQKLLAIMKIKRAKQLKDLKKLEITKAKQRKLKGGTGNEDTILV